jgi:hypothetical protein
MIETEHARKASTGKIALATFLLATTATMLGLDQTLHERRFFMTKNAAASDSPSDTRANSVPPARDPKIAVEEEYQMARQAGTAQALELFIARHPDSPLAEKARTDLRGLSR